jgi:hypothetical protein
MSLLMLTAIVMPLPLIIVQITPPAILLQEVPPFMPVILFMQKPRRNLPTVIAHKHQ